MRLQKLREMKIVCVFSIFIPMYISLGEYGYVYRSRKTPTPDEGKNVEKCGLQIKMYVP